jgi:glycosyltransferase involved in cell wall biosynthesis
MKLFISSNSSWTLVNFRLKLMEALKDNGFEVHAISLEDDYTTKIKEAGFKFHPLTIEGKGANPVSDYKLVKQYKAIFKQHKPDIVLNFTIKPVIYSTIAAKQLGIPVINNIAGLGNLFVRKTWITKIAIMLYRFSQKKVEHIFFQNEEDIELFKNLEVLKDQSFSRLPGSGVDTKRFLPTATKNKQFNFLLFGRMLWEKGIQEYVDASTNLKANYPYVKFNIAGILDFQNPSAISAETMTEWIDEGIIDYLGKSNKVEELIEHADCIVYPSYYREGVPRSLLESAAMGKPIIATDNVGCREVVEDGVNGYQIPVRDVNALAIAMKKMLNATGEQLKEFGANSRKLIENKFDEQLVITAYLTEIKKALNK